MNREEIISILSEVKDPEIPVLSICDLGILRSVEYAEGRACIVITPTYSGCPAMDVIREDIRASLALHGLYNVEVKQVLSPAWTTEWMSESGRNKLREYGIAPPSKSCSSNGNDQPLNCPQCQSARIEMVSRFGSTPCKALYRCMDCQEPFDYFKCH